MNDSEILSLAQTGLFDGNPLGGSVEHTHISWVILTGVYAFKIKKPVKMSFLDFSSLSKRKKFCEKELFLNRRFSGIYLDVIAVRKSKERWELGDGKGRIVDYAVRMKRLNSEKRMDKVLQTGKAYAHYFLSLAKQVSSFHQEAQVISRPFKLNEASETFDDIETIHTLVLKELGKEYADIVEEAICFSRAFLRLHIRRFKERIRLGFQRDVHGDLHSGNIFLYRQPVVFDCVEFNDKYRQIDVLSEIAFFCMDLEFYGHYSLSNLFIDQYTKMFPCFQTAEDNALFIYYKLARANVRAKIHGLSALESGEKDELEMTRKYLLLMRDYMKQVIL